MDSNRQRPRPVVGVTLGDPSGIGPEVVLRALADGALRRRGRFVVIGSAAVVRRTARRLGLDDSFLTVSKAFGAPEGEEVVLWNAAPAPARLALLGEPTAEGGAASVAWVERGVSLAMEGRLDALVTAPISKTAMHMAGLPWPGHTELLEARTGARQAVMTMVGGGLRVALVTTHLPLARVPCTLTRARILGALRVFAEGLRRDFGVADPRIAVCGLNPHAGEGGRFGREEARAIAPAIETARAQGIACAGPIPADAVFAPAREGRYGGVLAMYHDQGCIPVKLLAFESGVNVTLGLPIVRTSPDHGTAYDIAAKGCAHPGSMKAALRLALEIARRRAGRGK